MISPPRTDPRGPEASTDPSPSDTTEPAILEQERVAFRELLRLVPELVAAEADVNRRRSSNDQAADQEYQRSKQELLEKREARTRATREADEAKRRSIVDAAIAGEAAAKDEFGRASRKFAAEFDALRERARTVHQKSKSQALGAHDVAEREAVARFGEAIRPVDKAAKVLGAMQARLAAVRDSYGKFGLAELEAKPSRGTFNFDDPSGELLDKLARAEPDLELLESLYLPRMLKGRRDLWLFVVTVVIFCGLAVWMGGGAPGLGGGLAAGLAIGYLLRAKLHRVAGSQVDRLSQPLGQTFVDAAALAAQCRAQAEELLRTERARAAERREAALAQAKQVHAKTIADGEALRDDRLRRINEIYAQKMVEVQTTQQQDLRDALEERERRLAELRAQFESGSQRLEEKYGLLKAKIRDQHDEAWDAMEARWRGGMARVMAVHERVVRDVDAVGPRWDDPSWPERTPPKLVPPVLRFGEFRVALDQFPEGLPSDPRLLEGIPGEFTFPTVVPFPAHANLLIEAPGAGRAAACAALQSAMLRLLTSLPPGSVRFTIVDPAGIGRGFGAFMHLADYDDALVTQQVWTEPRQVEERLADLSAHMEKVAQRYLRNEYATIGEYNAVAGEVAEPYRVLVVADFPAGFDEKAAARLASIVQSGTPCGVLALVAVDLDRPLPTGISLDDLRRGATRLSWRDGRLAWDDPDFGRHALELDQPPPAERATALVHRVGTAARDTRRVEVPFEFIAPPADRWWTGDSRSGVDVALGKSGATKRQHLVLGQGTSQHVLLAGRTGSGKSTLLHALITNLALNYSPDEIDLYLIDFKKGVEFKVYATHELPHASVVAIESEREFGISVLQRLDAELRARADRFRDAGVQDVQGYRNTPGTPPLPRILLIVDEFQEFFVEEDKLAQEAALLLDRLVRQGRAFGVHVHLGSQSLGGAYALARTTLGQMAIRIALQCSDADAHLILSEQNTAARLLSRPGEAVYNDANGMSEGNHFFQVVWLSDDRREDYLRQISELAAQRRPALARTPLVFEGDAKAELARNALLEARLDRASWPPSPRSAQAWLGDPIAIKDPTAALFRRQAGNHLLIVGQNEESALGIMTAALISLAAEYPPAESDTTRSGARFAVLDGTPEDHPGAEFLVRLAESLPHTSAAGGWRDVPRILAAVGEEVARRQQPGAPDGPEIFLLIHDLPRFRDLRRRENDFGFSRRDEEAGPADHLAAILREGPGVGVHLITWCDSLTNLNRFFDHQALREFELRVLFQMSPNDSGHLLDSPAASRLGPHRALYSSEEQNRLEKFRPYGVPPDDWLERFRERLRKRVAAVG